MVRTSPRLLCLLASLLLLAGACGGGGGGGADEIVEDDEPVVSAPDTTCAPAFDLVVFVNPAVSDDAITSIDQRLRSLPGVIDLTYVDQQSAYAEFLELFADQPEMLSSIGPEDVPPSFRLTLDDPSRAADVQAAAQSLDGVGQVVVPQAPAASC